jgi:thioredoxin-like negative regulator of GroEL
MSSRRRKGSTGRRPAAPPPGQPNTPQIATPPTGLDDLLARATEHRTAGRLAEAEPLYEQVLKADPGNVGASYFLALIDLKFERLHRALDRLRMVTEARPQSFDAWEAIVYAHQTLGQWPQAVEACARALAVTPDSAKMRYSLATTFTIMGRIPDALAEYRKIAGELPERLAGLVRIAELDPGAITPEEFDVIAKSAYADDTDADLRGAVLFALGELYERQGRYDEAFDAFAAGNQLKRSSLTPTAAPEPALIRRPVRALSAEIVVRAHDDSTVFFKKTFTREFIRKHEGGGHPFAAPIFIVGLPRCGSTLLEQILGSHSTVRGMGESGAMGVFVRHHFPLKTDAPMEPNHFRRLADRYISNMVAQGWDGRLRLLDKTLNNYNIIGLIHLMFPKAVILHSVRDPVDTCMGCFRKLFRTSNEWTYDLGDIGRVYVQYRQLMDHWAQVLPGRVIDVSYEALVADPDAQIRQLVTETCGLEWQDACLNFHASQNPVRTASLAQIRQPIFKTSIERWRRYEGRLGPLFDAMGPYAPAGVGQPAVSAHV